MSATCLGIDVGSTTVKVVALVPTIRIAKIEQWWFRAGTTALVGFGTATLALTTFLIVVIVAITRGF